MPLFAELRAAGTSELRAAMTAVPLAEGNVIRVTELGLQRPAGPLSPLVRASIAPHSAIFFTPTSSRKRSPQSITGTIGTRLFRSGRVVV